MKKFLLLISLILLASSCGEESGSNSFTDGVLDDEHRIFITSQAFNGNLSGLSGADSKCMSLANMAKLKRSYKALISDSTANAFDRISLKGPVYVFDTNGGKIEIASYSSFWDTSSQSLSHAIIYDEAQTSISGVDAWTGSDSEGKHQIGTNKACNDWNSALNSVDGDYGTNNFLDARWIEIIASASCDNMKRLYCISQ